MCHECKDLFYFVWFFVAIATITFNEAQYVLVTLPQESYTEAEDISLRFRTLKANGLLLMTASSTSEDAIELYLERGACKLTVSLGTGSKVSVQIIALLSRLTKSVNSEDM